MNISYYIIYFSFFLNLYIIFNIILCIRNVYIYILYNIYIYESNNEHFEQYACYCKEK